MPFLWQQPHLLSATFMLRHPCFATAPATSLLPSPATFSLSLWQQLRQKWNANVANYARIPHTRYPLLCTLPTPTPTASTSTPAALTCQLLTMQSPQRRQRLSHSSASFFVSPLFFAYLGFCCVVIYAGGGQGQEVGDAPGNSCQPGYVCGRWGREKKSDR